VHFNSGVSSLRGAAAPKSPDGLVTEFHKRLPRYAPSPLISLGGMAREAGVGAVYVKDESSRLGLPSFKILGASWGTFRAITQRLSLPLSTTIIALREILATSRPLKLYAATDGNHGRAVARMGSILSVPVEVHVPAGMAQTTIEFIESEGAVVVKSTGSYEDAIAAAYEGAKRNEGGILIQDTAFDGYEDIPAWIVDGYSTMLREIDDQLGDKLADLVITPVGVGSLAQSVVTHFKAPGGQTAVVTVEPDTAACLWRSLREGESVITETTPTIMAGLDCGAVSTIAWPILKAGVDASMTVSDYEAHIAAVDLQSMGVDAGPCGSAPLAALRRLTAEEKSKLGLTRDSVILLLCTEASREYDIPHDVAGDVAVA
jgi:diaminopropionate ammonia-lyase family